MALNNTSNINPLLVGAPNRAPAIKVLAGALSNSRVANSLVNALGNYAMVAAVTSSSVSPTNAQFAGLAIGDLIIHVPATAGNVQSAAVTVVNTLPITPVIGDLYLALRVINLDANNPAPGAGYTSNGGQEF